MRPIGNEVHGENVLRKMGIGRRTGTVLDVLGFVWAVITLLDGAAYIVAGLYFAGRFIAHLPLWHF